MTRFLSIYTGPVVTDPTEEGLALIEDRTKAGSLLAIEGCRPGATFVRQDNGSVTVHDGPFTETKEVVGGLGILEVGNKDEAIEWVKPFLAAAGNVGECEIR